jgi:hypothetical protein
VAAGEKEHITWDGTHALYYAVCPLANVCRGFATWRAVAK